MTEKEKVYGLTYDPEDKGSYSMGPTPDHKTLLNVAPNPGVVAEIHLLNKDADPTVLYRWENGDWTYLFERHDPFDKGERAQLVLGEMELTGATNEVLMVSLKVDAITVESKIQPAQYEQVRGYTSLAPANLWLHVPITNPGRLVNDGGNVEILGAVFRHVAHELDRAVFDVASMRVDMRTVQHDKKTARFSAGQITKKEVQPSAKCDEGEVL